MQYIPYITRSILTFSKTKWRSQIAKHVNLLNFRRQNLIVNISFYKTNKFVHGKCFCMTFTHLLICFNCESKLKSAKIPYVSTSHEEISVFLQCLVLSVLSSLIMSICCLYVFLQCLFVLKTISIG